jgi:hypothetical protein
MKDEARRVLAAAVTAYPCNWSAWLVRRALALALVGQRPHIKLPWPAAAVACAPGQYWPF